MNYVDQNVDANYNCGSKKVGSNKLHNILTENIMQFMVDQQSYVLE